MPQVQIKMALVSWEPPVVVEDAIILPPPLCYLTL